MDSTQCIDPDQSAQFTQAHPDRHIPYHGDRLMISEIENPQEAKISIRVSLRGMIQLIRIDTTPSQQCWFSRGTAHFCFPNKNGKLFHFLTSIVNKQCNYLCKLYHLLKYIPPFMLYRILGKPNSWKLLLSIEVLLN